MTDSITIKALSDDENGTLNVLLKQLAEKSKRNLLRSSVYDGKRAIKQVGTVIPPQYKKLGLILGWNAKGVDGLARRCNLEGMVWADGSLAELGMQELTDSNFLLSEVASGRTDSLIHGVSYLITTQGGPDEPKALIHAKDGTNATGTWNNRKRRLDDLLSVTARNGDDVTGFALYLDGLTISANLRGNEWEVSKSTHPWHVPADPLVYRPRASRRMGRSRMTRATIGLQDAAVRALIRMEGHMDVYSIPQLWLLGAPDSIFKNADGSQKASWQVALGRVYGVPDNTEAGTPQNERADVKQVNAQSPEAHLAQMNALAKLTAREFDLSDADFALTDMANPTSEGSYSEARENLIAEAEGAMDDWSISIRRSVTRALAIQNGLNEVPKEWASIDTKWRKAQFVSRASAADAGAKQLGAVPWLAETEVGLGLLGLDEQTIKLALSQREAAQRRLQTGSLVDSLRASAAKAVADPAVAAVASARTGD